MGWNGNPDGTASRSQTFPVREPDARARPPGPGATKGRRGQDGAPRSGRSVGAGNL